MYKLVVNSRAMFLNFTFNFIEKIPGKWKKCDGLLWESLEIAYRNDGHSHTGRTQTLLQGVVVYYHFGLYLCKV